LDRIRGFGAKLGGFGPRLFSSVDSSKRCSDQQRVDVLWTYWWLSLRLVLITLFSSQIYESSRPFRRRPI
jgi:hypothetical protein